MAVTIENNGAANTIAGGTFAGGIIVTRSDAGVATSLSISGATSTGQNASQTTSPPMSLADISTATHGIEIRDGCSFSDGGGNTFTGGNGAPGVTTLASGRSGLNLPQLGIGSGLFSIGADVTLAGSTYSGGNYQPGDPGSLAVPGGAGATIINPPTCVISACTLTGGASESTLQGPPGLVVVLTGTVGVDIGGTTPTPTITGGSGASQGPCVAVSNTGSGLVNFVGGIFSGPIALNLAPGAGRVRFTIGSDPSPSLTTSAVNLLLQDGNRLNVAITGASACSVNVTGSYLELVP